MSSRGIEVAGGISLIAGALAFVGVFSYLAARFSYPQILDGKAAEVLPRLRGGGARMRAVWALYSVLPLLLIFGAAGASSALSAGGAASLALALAAVGALAMCLGLMRWPTVHWRLAEAYESASEDGRHTLAAIFEGLNLYLGNYLGEFLGEVCLAGFFLVTGVAMRVDARFPSWLGWGGAAFGLLFLVGAFRNVTRRVQRVADLNNLLLPLWMIVLGGSILWFPRPS